MRHFLFFILYLAVAAGLLLGAYRLVELYHVDADELQMLKKKQSQMAHGVELDSSWVVAKRSCNAIESVDKLNDVGSGYESFNLVSVQPKEKHPCDNYTLASEKDSLYCYPVSMVWNSTFTDGVNLMKDYQSSCMFLFENIRVNVTQYPTVMWEVSGWTVQKGSTS